MDWFSQFLLKLKNHEGLRLKPYDDTRGIKTIGYGMNLEAGFDAEEQKYIKAQNITFDHGITWAQAEWFLEHRARMAVNAAQAYFKGFVTLSDNRKIALADMAYNLGYPRLCQFKLLLKALQKGDFQNAGTQMLSSAWAKQVGSRALELANMMRNG